MTTISCKNVWYSKKFANIFFKNRSEEQNKGHGLFRDTINCPSPLSSIKAPHFISQQLLYCERMIPVNCIYDQRHIWFFVLPPLITRISAELIMVPWPSLLVGRNLARRNGRLQCRPTTFIQCIAWWFTQWWCWLWSQLHFPIFSRCVAS